MRPRSYARIMKIFSLAVRRRHAGSVGAPGIEAVCEAAWRGRVRARAGGVRASFFGIQDRRFRGGKVCAQKRGVRGNRHSRVAVRFESAVVENLGKRGDPGFVIVFEHLGDFVDARATLDGVDVESNRSVIVKLKSSLGAL